jgi:hypothetical protein
MAIGEPTGLPEADAMSRFDLRERLQAYGPGAQEARTDVIVEVVEGDLLVLGDLLVDYAAGRRQVEGIRPRADGDRNATTLKGATGLIVTGDLTVHGALVNANLNGGPFLLVLGKTQARALFAGGAEFAFEGRARFEDVVVGCYNDGYVAFRGGVEAPMVISEDHAFDIRGDGPPPFVDYFNGEGDTEDLARRLDPEIECSDPTELDAENQLLPRIRLGLRVLSRAASAE